MIIKLQNHSTTLVLFRIVCNIHGLILSYLHCSFDLCSVRIFSYNISLILIFILILLNYHLSNFVLFIFKCISIFHFKVTKNIYHNKKKLNYPYKFK